MIADQSDHPSPHGKEVDILTAYFSARFAFDPETLTHKIHAARTIHPGEELTVSCTSPPPHLHTAKADLEDIDEKSPYALRQAHIHAHWGFTCTCSHCSLPLDLRNLSDARISTLNTLRTSLLDFTPSSTATPSIAIELIKLYEEEELWGVSAEAYMLAALRLAMWEDEEGTRSMAAKAVGAWLVWEKRGEKNKEEMMLVAREPRRAWCWGLRRSRKDEL